MRNGELIIYQTEDGLTQINFRAIDGTVWLTQIEIADLFDKGRSTIAEHIQTVLSDGELDENSVCRNFRRTAKDGKYYNVLHYNLDMILAVGFHVRSTRGVQFRRWASIVLKDYLVKGFAMDDERLKGTDNWDYFDEWLARIRDIRASEKRFYQKVKDLYATAVDYDRKSEQAQQFFKKVQNKMLWAVTGKTAAELIANRSDSSKVNMGLTSFKGSIVRKSDVGIAKNYLQQDEIYELNHIVTMYLDYAEDQAKMRKTISMDEWTEKLDVFLKFNERNLLTHAGTLKMEVAQELSAKRYDEFDAKRKVAEALTADKENIKELEAFEKSLIKRDKRKIE